jgi:hypothetical protein
VVLEPGVAVNPFDVAAVWIFRARTVLCAAGGHRVRSFRTPPAVVTTEMGDWIVTHERRCGCKRRRPAMYEGYPVTGPYA